MTISKRKKNTIYIALRSDSISANDQVMSEEGTAQVLLLLKMSGLDAAVLSNFWRILFLISRQFPRFCNDWRSPGSDAIFMDRRIFPAFSLHIVTGSQPRQRSCTS